MSEQLRQKEKENKQLSKQLKEREREVKGLK